MADGAKPQDMQGASATARRFSAFISYSHADENFARRLHRRLEGYRLPRRLLKTQGVAAGRRLKPLFRDSDELSASYDLSAAVREAIEASDYLIVVCSPAAAKSVWVGREIEQFRALHGDEAILATIVEGSSETAFHPALHGRPGSPALSPLAADFRPQGAGQRLALLRLVAALAGVHLDDLVHRDAQRQVQRIALAGAGAVAGIAVVASLAVYGLNARHDAEAQSHRASGLGDFLVGDLRSGLEAAGRHDLLDQVNRASLESYRGVDPSRLTPDQLEQLAKAKQGAGKDAEKLGDLKTARARFDEALKITTPLLAAKPNDPQRLFVHAQSEYWEGFVNWREGHAAEARAGFDAYARLSAQLVATDPKNDTWRMEAVYSANNLGMLALRQAGDPALAESYFRTALAQLDTISRHQPTNTAVMDDRANAFAWLADSQRLQGHLKEAAAARASQRQVLEERLAADPRNIEVQAHLLGYKLAVARIALAQGETQRAVSLLEAGRKQALELAAQDPQNKDFLKQARMFELFEARIWLGSPPRAQPSAAIVAKTIGDCTPLGPGAVNREISDFCGVLLARFRAQQGDKAGAEAALAPVRQHAVQNHDVLTARWGLDMADETRLVQLAQQEKGR